MSDSGENDYTLGLCPKETKALDAWYDRHKRRCLKPYHVKITRTGIGSAITIACGCGQTKDITHYDHW